jgi:hypothetical protein
MAKSVITQTLGGPSHGVLGLIEISDKIARLSEAGWGDSYPNGVTPYQNRGHHRVACLSITETVLAVPFAM